MMRKFIQTPMAIQDDVLMGRLIGNDLVVYNYLAIKGAHGKPFFFSNQRMGDSSILHSTFSGRRFVLSKKMIHFLQPDASFYKTRIRES